MQITLIYFWWYSPTWASIASYFHSNTEVQKWPILPEVNFFFFENLSTQGKGVAESAYHPYLLVIKHNYYSTSTHWIWNDKAHSAKLAIIISYSTSTGQILVLFKIPLKYKKLNFNLKRNKNNAKNYAHACHICRAWYNGSELLKWIIQWSRLWQIRLYQSTLILFLIKF